MLPIQNYVPSPNKKINDGIRYSLLGPKWLYITYSQNAFFLSLRAWYYSVCTQSVYESVQQLYLLTYWKLYSGWSCWQQQNVTSLPKWFTSIPMQVQWNHFWQASHWTMSVHGLAFTGPVWAQKRQISYFKLSSMNSDLFLGDMTSSFPAPIV